MLQIITHLYFTIQKSFYIFLWNENNYFDDDMFWKLAIVRKSFPNLAISYRFVSFSVALSFTVLSARRSHCLLPSYITVLLTIISFLSLPNFRFTRDSTIVGNFILSSPKVPMTCNLISLSQTRNTQLICSTPVLSQLYKIKHNNFFATKINSARV